MTLVVRQAAWLATTGVCCGLAIAALTSKTLSYFLYGVSPSDVRVFAAVAAVVFATVVVAALQPARRAASVDPVLALRHE